MAIIFCDGFDHYASGDITEKWDAEHRYGSDSIGLTAGQGRFGTSGWGHTNVTSHIWKAFPSGPLSTVTVGAGYNPTNGIGTDYPYASVFKFMSGTSKLCGVGVSSQHQLFAYTWDGSDNRVILGYATEPIRTATFQYIECQVGAFHPTAGSIIVKMNGQEVINLTGVCTDGTSGYTVAEALYLGGAGIGYGGALSIYHGGAIYYDDVYITDTSDDSGAGNTGFLGDVRIEELMPNADGYYKEWTPSTGTDHYALVDDNPPDDDTTYVSTLTVGTRDTYTFPSVTPTSGTVKGVCVNIIARKQDAGSSELCAIGRLGTTDAEGTPVWITSEYAVWQSYMERDPTGATWTIANVNASQFGPKLIG